MRCTDSLPRRRALCTEGRNAHANKNSAMTYTNLCNQLRVCEIFHSIQGEASFVGQPCTFVRLTGCNLHCVWCDTEYAQNEGQWMDIETVLGRVSDIGCPLVEVTGGEPMVQAGPANVLMARLLDTGHTVLLETNGSLPLDGVPMGVHRIIDLKAPGSCTRHNADVWHGYAAGWRNTDEIKCVVACREDFDWCVEKLHHYGAFNRVIIHFSPVWGAVAPASLAEWICSSHLPIRMNLQIHKVIWDPNARGV